MFVLILLGAIRYDCGQGGFLETPYSANDFHEIDHELSEAPDT